MKSVDAGAFPEAEHDHKLCVKAALARAGILCRDRGARLTALRRRVLELVWSGHRPLGAYEILDILRLERASAAPPTVYRALDFLLDLGLVHRIESMNAYVGCCSPETNHGGQFLICGACGSAAELTDKRIDEAIGQSAAEIGFSVVRRTIEVEGLCPHCLKTEGVNG
ncbi:MAG: transcriptional repressor [Rhodospirillales bacterium]